MIAKRIKSRVDGADVVMDLLNVHPEFIQMIDESGNSPLHYASSERHREITGVLLKRDPTLAEKYDSNGHTPLHLAVINYKCSVLQGFFMMAPESFQCLTKEEETVIHVAVRHNQFNALVFLIQVCNAMNMLSCGDRHGDTALHLAVSVGNHQVKSHHAIFRRARAINNAKPQR